MLGTVLLIVLILMLLGAIPTWPHSRNWGYGPSGGLGLVLLIIMILLLLNRLYVLVNVYIERRTNAMSGKTWVAPSNRN